MFHRKKIILFVSRTKIIVYKITLKKKPVEQILGQYDWTSGALGHILVQIVKRYGKNIRLLLDDSLTYIAQISFPPGKMYTREDIRKQAQEIIPESLKDTIWDTRDITAFTRSGNKTLQVVALIGSFYTEASQLFNKLRLNIEYMQPFSFALAESVVKEKDPVVVIYVHYGILFVLVNKGVVLITEKTSEEFSVSVLHAFLNFVTRHAQGTYKKIILAGAFEEKHTKALLEAKIASGTLLINPQINLALKERPRSKDEEFFNFYALRQQTELEKISDSVSQTKQKVESGEGDMIGDINQKPHKKNSKTKNILLILFLIVLWSGMGYVAYTMLLPKRKTTAPQQSVNPIITPRSTPPLQLTPTIGATESAKVNVSDFSYTILNGSGISGEATRLSEILKEKGIVNIEVGNASGISANTVVASKKEVSEEIVNNLDNILKDNYNNIIRSLLPDDEASDIVITIGTQ